MKKLLILAILVALGLIAAKRLREPDHPTGAGRSVPVPSDQHRGTGGGERHTGQRGCCRKVRDGDAIA